MRQMHLSPSKDQNIFNLAGLHVVLIVVDNKADQL